MLIASKTGNIAAAKLVAEEADSWVLTVENREVRISKTDKHQQVFTLMSAALKWAKADDQMIDHFLSLEAAEGTAGGKDGAEDCQPVTVDKPYGVMPDYP